MEKLTKRRRILLLLAESPKTAFEIAEAVDDITPCVARSMAAYRHEGAVRNLNPGNGRVALYAITEAGRTALKDQS